MHLLREFVRLTLDATSLNEASFAEIGRRIANASPKVRRGGGGSGHVRIQPTDPEICMSAHEFKQVLHDAGLIVVGEVGPGSPGSFSSRFMTYEVQDETGETVSVVLGCGSNAGQEYEAKKFAELSLAVDAGEISPFVTALINKIGISLSDIVSVENSGKRNASRQLQRLCVNCGEDIADFTINTTTGPLYISLKNLKGGIFGNHGYTGGFQQVGNQVISGEHPLDHFLLSMGIDKQVAAAGLTDYLNGQETKAQNAVAPIHNYDEVQKYLAGSLGHGYYYVRETRDGIKVIPILSEADALSFVGVVEDVSVRYPRGPQKSKQITATIHTTEAKFKVEIRNSHRGILPNEIKVKVT